ncbi:MAG: PD-(D/E)XK nuclease family protein [Anaerovoracaceae bacterium]
MINIYYGRENINKEKFIFDQIKKSGKENIVLIVPDQYSLEAERQAFSYLETKALLNLEILSMSRIGSRILKEVGGAKKTVIDKQGRQILLSRIMEEEEDNLKLFKGNSKRNNFIQMMNDLISELKQYNTSAEDLLERSQDFSSYLKLKLEDIALIYGKYQSRIEGKYVDTEDYIDLYKAAISKSKWISDNEFWVYGFDYFTPKNLDFILALAGNSKAVNLVLTFDDNIRARDSYLFNLSNKLIRRINIKGEEENIAVNQRAIADSYIKEKDKNLAAIERELFSNPMAGLEDGTGRVKLVQSANIYAEGETAAAYIKHLLREKKYRYRDIAVVCNDLEKRGKIFQKIFEEYEIPVFLDAKSKVLNNPVKNLIKALLKVVGGNFKLQDVISLLKTGLTDITVEEIEDLEKYAKTYKIAGKKWKEEFHRGENEYQEKLVEIENSRKKLIDPLLEYNEAYKKDKTVKGRTETLHNFLTKEMNLPEKLEVLSLKQLEYGGNESADITEQIWNLSVGIMEQIVELLSDEKLTAEEYADLITVGIDSIEMGLLPSRADQILMGTMQRTRTGDIKALLILGANEGLLPSEPAGKSIISEDEILALVDDTASESICKLGVTLGEEENLAIYRNLSKPSEYLFMSMSVSDEEGKVTRPSRIFERMRELFAGNSLEKDIISAGGVMDLIQAKNSTLRHLSNELAEGKEKPLIEKGLETDSSKKMSDEEVVWAYVLKWFVENEKEKFKLLNSALDYDGRQGNIDDKLAKKLFERGQGNFVKFSPSQLEKYGDCPFAHFVSYGLRAKEEELFEITPMDLGNLFHSCFEAAVAELSSSDMPEIKVSDENSLWMKANIDTCKEIVDKAFSKEENQYRQGLLNESKIEQYRVKRIKEVCIDATWAMIRHIQKGKIEEIYAEAEFKSQSSKRLSLPPISLDVDGKEVRIEGKIDRVDILPGNNVKVVDYKTGYAKFTEGEAKGGLKLQLYLYLKAAAEKVRTPVGAFYFGVKDIEVAADTTRKANIEDLVSEKVSEGFRLSGIIKNDEGIISDIDIELSTEENQRRNAEKMLKKKSDIIGVKLNKSNELQMSSKAYGTLLEADDFEKFMTDVNDKITEICGEILEGKTEAIPAKKITKTKKSEGDACQYCNYKGICKFNINFSGCKNRLVEV